MVPRPVSIDPPVAYGGAPTAVVVRGDGFYVRGVQLASGGSRIDTHHRAWVGGIELADVTWVDVQTIGAVVPAGLAPGTYDVSVENALGDRGVLAGAYRVLGGSPALLRASMDARPVANLGQLVSVTLTVTNDGDATALAFTPVLSVEGGGALAPLGTAPATADVPARSAVTFAWSFRASALGDAVLAAQGEGLDGGTGVRVPLPPASASVKVVRPAALSMQVLSAPARVNVGQGFDVTWRVENTGDSDAANATMSVTASSATPGSVSATLGTLRGERRRT